MSSNTTSTSASTASIPPYSAEGVVHFARDGETHETYYKVYGDLASSEHAPLVVLHGGPGLSHDYLLPLADLWTKHAIPVVFYDQIGNARSSHLPHKPKEFWTVELFVNELENLVTKLKIADNFRLFGHSWGGCLGAEFEVRRAPAGLRSLILCSSLASGALWQAATGQLLGKFPDEVKAGMMAGMSDPEKFFPALLAFQKVHICNVEPTPSEVKYSLDRIFGEDGDPTVGTAPIMKGWSIIDRLDKVRVPTLVTNGASEQAADSVVAPFFQKINKVKWVTMGGSTHMAFWEERERYISLVADFLAL